MRPLLQHRHRLRRGRAASTLALLAAGLGLAAAEPVVAGPGIAAAAVTVDEVHVSWGPDGTSATIHWRGSPTALRYGRTAALDLSATGGAPAVRAVDDPGPFREATLTGLTPGAEYRYRIADGPVRLFRSSPPPGSPVRWVDIGDTASTTCKPWMASQHALIAELAPQLVTHGGDMSYANECGVRAVHQMYDDVQVWAATGTSSAAFMPVWGNHEYGPPRGTAPPGTPRDSLANYKARHAIPNPQAVPADTAQRVTAPGCPSATGANACRGEDWGWFRAGNVLLISYPEPWGTTSLPSWRAKADALMAAAQADPDVHVVVTYGHRPPLSSGAGQANATVTAAIAALADRFSPRARSDGKYVLNLSHHVHAEEVFPDFHGIAAVVNGGGGTAQNPVTTPIAGSVHWSTHPAVALLEYTPGTRSLDLRLICGATIPGSSRDPCIRGTTIFRSTLLPGARAAAAP